MADELNTPPVRERADAARNRIRVLDAAERLFARHGVAGVSMDDVALEAGVGKGTLYRRFGDKSGLAAALLDDREREFQHRMMSGPPPLGPGAPPKERLEAFAASYLAFVVANLDLVEMLETRKPGERFHSGVHGLWRMHCAALLDQAGVPDPILRAELLMAALTAEQVRYWAEQDERSMDEIATGLMAAVGALAS